MTSLRFFSVRSTGAAVDFRKRSPQTPNYLGKRFQRRMLLYLAALFVILFLISEAGKPQNWWWFGEIAQPQRREVVDTRLRPRNEAEGPPDAFVALPAAKTKDEQVEAAKPFLERVQRDLLRRVQDDTPFRGAKEHDAFFHLLHILDTTDQSAIDAAPAPRVSYLQLYNQSKEYRGDLVASSGIVRRAHRLTPPGNKYGIEEYYQIWFQPSDDKDQVMVLYALELPKGFPEGMELRELVSVRGFYYKRWAYEAADTIRTAPLLLVKTLDWRTETAAKKKDDLQMPLIIGLSVAGVTILLLGVIYFATRKSGMDDLPDYVRRNMKQEDASALQDQPLAPSVEESLADLARGDHERENPWKPETFSNPEDE